MEKASDKFRERSSFVKNDVINSIKEILEKTPEGFEKEIDFNDILGCSPVVQYVDDQFSEVAGRVDMTGIWVDANGNGDYKLKYEDATVELLMEIYDEIHDYKFEE